MQVTGGGDSREAEYAVISLGVSTIDIFLKRCALASALKQFDTSLGHLSFHGYFCEWLAWSDRLDELLGGKELVVLDKRPRGKPIQMDGCYTETWSDGDVYFTAFEKHVEGQPVLQAGPVNVKALEEIKSRLAPTT